MRTFFAQVSWRTLMYFFYVVMPIVESYTQMIMFNGKQIPVYKSIPTVEINDRTKI